MGNVAPSPAWQVWWSFNSETFLQLEGRISGLDRVSDGHSALFPTRAQIEEEVLPALDALLVEGGHTPLVRAALIAMARLEDDVPGGGSTRSVADVARVYLESEFPDAREASLVALGVQGEDESIDILIALLENEEGGQELRGGPVESRTRAFAAYSLGILAREREDAGLRERIGQSLHRVITQDEHATRELHVACLLSMGLAPAVECGDEHRVDHVCRTFQAGTLVKYLRDENRDADLRAHAAAALGRLSIGATDEFRRTIAGILTDYVDARSKHDEDVIAGAAIGLGHALDADRDPEDVAGRGALEDLVHEGEGLAQRFALVSLAYAGARPGSSGGDGQEDVRSFLHGLLGRGRGGLDAWAAVALGVHEFNRISTARDEPDDELGHWLEAAVGTRRKHDRSSAAAIALGVLRHRDAGETLLDRFEEAEDPGLRGYAALALGLVSHEEARAPMREVLAEGDDARVMYGAALGLRLLGDDESGPLLVERMRELREERALARQAGEDAKVEFIAAEEVLLAEALGLLGDRRTLSDLVAFAGDSQSPGEVRTACTIALGTMCDADALSWAAPISSDLHYGAIGWTLVDPFGGGTGLLDMR